MRSHVEDVTDFSLGNDQAMAWLNRSDVEERKVIVIFPNPVAGNFSGDDRTEDATHPEMSFQPS
jgi:hypothetical protein